MDSDSQLKLTSLGGEESGASCFLVEIGDKKILLDCGLNFFHLDKITSDWEKIFREVDGVIISHAHIDHCSALPLLVKAGNDKVKIWATIETKVLLHQVLNDITRNNKFYQGTDLSFLEKIIPVEFENLLEIFPAINLILFPAGHILGAAMIFLEFVEIQKNIFYTGDFSLKDQLTVNGAKFPQNLGIDYLITETTAGQVESRDEDESELLISKVKEVLTRKNKVLFPCSALGRAQEIILLLRKAMAEKKIPPVKIYIDGFCKDICKTYTYLSGGRLVFLAGRTVFRGNNNRFDLINNKKPAIIISTNPTFSNSPSADYALGFMFLGNGKDTIFYYGFTKKQVVEENLIALKREKIPKAKKMNCRVEHFYLTVHPVLADILSLVDVLQPKKIFLVHGSKQAKQTVKERLENDIVWQNKIFIPERDQEFEI